VPIKALDVLFTVLSWLKSSLRIHKIMFFFKTQFKVKIAGGARYPLLFGRQVSRTLPVLGY
jgi:hypothetical protein